VGGRGLGRGGKEGQRRWKRKRSFLQDERNGASRRRAVIRGRKGGGGSDLPREVAKLGKEGGGLSRGGKEGRPARRKNGLTSRLSRTGEWRLAREGAEGIMLNTRKKGRKGTLATAWRTAEEKKEALGDISSETTSADTYLETEGRGDSQLKPLIDQ